VDQRQRRNANGWRLGVDVGGTKIATLLVDGDNRVWASVQRPTDTATPDHALKSLADAIWETLKQADLPIRLLAGIGIGIPGQVDTQSGIVRHAVNLGWQAVDLRGFINATFGTACVIENDVRAAALGIQRYWLAGSIDSMLYVSIGTGIAAGMILDGTVYRGSHGMAAMHASDHQQFAVAVAIMAVLKPSLLGQQLPTMHTLCSQHSRIANCINSIR